MKYVSSYKNVKNSAALDVDIQETFEKFSAYFDDDFTCYATVSQKGKGEAIKCVEITIRAGKHTFRAESVTDSFHKSVDANYDKIKKQIRRHKDKLLTLKRQNTWADNVSDEVVEEEDVQDIIRKKRFKVYPMTPDEAAMQMDLLSHNFFVFLNAYTSEVNVVYKREDGGYGVIEVEC